MGGNRWKSGLWTPDERRETFWSKVGRNGPEIIPGSLCWPWEGKIASKGYGQFEVEKGHHVQAHRQAFIYTYGPLAEDLMACHTCDYPPCCRPDHLFSGTGRDNAMDCIEKGRAHRRSGAEHPMAKLFPFIAAICDGYESGATMVDLALLYGVSRSAIKQVLVGHSYAGIPIARPNLRSPSRAKHGTRAKYVKGCRCNDCTAANALYARVLRARRVAA